MCATSDQIQKSRKSEKWKYGVPGLSATKTKPTNKSRSKSYIIIERGEGRGYETMMRCMRFSDYVRGYRPSKLFSVDFDNLHEDVSLCVT